MNYSFLPEKVTVTRPIYAMHHVCPRCASTKSVPLMNMEGSLRHCDTCKQTFKPRIVGYKKEIVEKMY